MLLHKDDNVSVDLNNGHKYATRLIRNGENVIKYGNPIGHATQDIAEGEHVHSHNMATNLSDDLTYRYASGPRRFLNSPTLRTFMGYRRKDGTVGIRNDIWIVNTESRVNEVAERLAQLTGALAFPHCFECGQPGENQQITQKILRGMVNHPNAGGVLVLGCENNHIEAFKKVLGKYDSWRVRFLNCQDTKDEIATGTRLIKELQAYAATFRHEPIPLFHLVVGLKCGGSEGHSGITANPLVGRFSDKLIRMGGSCLLTEVPEMFGTEHLLMERCANRAAFHKTVALINDFKDYYKRHGRVIYEDLSPDDKDRGITTLEEKSLCCVQKAGSAPVVDVLGYGDRVRENGLSLLDGPVNDLVAMTNLVAAGAHLILFATDRGTPLGAPVPTVKVATNFDPAAREAGWVDFDASGVLRGENLGDELFDYVMRVVSGEQTANERLGCREISIFKDGVTV